MPRMFDILKSQMLGPDGARSKNDLSIPEAKGPSEPQEPENHSLVSRKLISAVKKHGVDNFEKGNEVYASAVNVIKALLAKVRSEEYSFSSTLGEINSLLDDIFNQLVLGDSLLSNVCLMPKDEYYLPYHITNTLILSSVIGMGLGFNKSRLNHLGQAAIFYDLELDALRDVIQQPRRLSMDEYAVVKTHIHRSLKLFNRINPANEVVRETIEMHHERVNGKGYPQGLTSDDINPYAKVIGLVDTYEAMINLRPYRTAMNEHDALRHILASLKDYFDQDVLRAFINKLSIYPIGSMVKLDTRELARVITVQSGSPLRPVVMIIQDANGEPLKERVIIDLSKQNFPSIIDSV